MVLTKYAKIHTMERWVRLPHNRLRVHHACSKPTSVASRTWNEPGRGCRQSGLVASSLSQLRVGPLGPQGGDRAETGESLGRFAAQSTRASKTTTPSAI